MAETIFNNPLEHEVSQLNSQITNFTSGTIDLNNYKTTGMYSYNGNASSNSPTTGTCTLIVQKYSNDFVTQMVTAVRSTGNLVYTRSFYDGTTWSAWRELAYSDQIANEDIKLFLTGSTQEITSAIDFNTLTEVKNYSLGQNSVAASCTNCPSNNAGKLCTYSNNGRSYNVAWQYGGQIYVDIAGNIYKRIMSTNGSKVLSFGAWEQVSLAPPVAETTLINSFYDNRVENIDTSGERTAIFSFGKFHVLSVSVKYLIKPASNQSTIIAVPSGIGLPSYQTWGTLLDRTNSKVYRTSITPQGNINIFHNGEPNIGDLVEGQISWVG